MRKEYISIPIGIKELRQSLIDELSLSPQNLNNEILTRLKTKLSYIKHIQKTTTGNNRIRCVITLNNVEDKFFNHIDNDFGMKLSSLYCIILLELCLEHKLIKNTTI